MRRLIVLLAVVALVGTSAAPALGRGFGDADGHQKRFFWTHLNGAQEVPPVDTDAKGLAFFRLSRDGERLHYILLVRNLVDVTQAHIHVGLPGENGPVTTFLFGPADPPVTKNGLLARGVIEAGDLVGPLAGQPLSALLEEMNTGNTYVNVHTVAHPPGEIRGQIR